MLLQKRSSALKWLARLHIGVMFFSFFLYLGLGFSLGPEFLYQDIRQKFFAFADDTIVVTAVVPGPPMAPVVTATPSCVSGASRVVLNWADDTGSTSFSIDRDSTTLTTGVVVSGYTDLAVVSNTTYSYQVTAYGPMDPGIALSSVVSVTTLDCAVIAPVTAQIETLGGKNVTSGHRQDIDLSRRRPKVTGTTNTPNAIIDIELTNPAIRARTLANSNGYFEWVPPIRLDTGSHILTVTAIDPADTNRTGSDSFIFWTKNSGSAETATEKKVEAQPVKEPFDFTVTIQNAENELFQEEKLQVKLTPNQVGFPEGASANIVLNNTERQDAFMFSEDFLLNGREGLNIEAPLPIYLTPGDYRVRADVTADGELVSREATVHLKGLPLLNIGGRTITYSEAASYIGVIFFSLLISFLFTLLLFVREYWLYLHSLRAITGRHLARLGLLGTRKGVIR